MWCFSLLLFNSPLRAGRLAPVGAPRPGFFASRQSGGRKNGWHVPVKMLTRPRALRSHQAEGASGRVGTGGRNRSLIICAEPWLGRLRFDYRNCWPALAKVASLMVPEPEDGRSDQVRVGEPRRARQAVALILCLRVGAAPNFAFFQFNRDENDDIQLLLPGPCPPVESAIEHHGQISTKGLILKGLNEIHFVPLAHVTHGLAWHWHGPRSAARGLRFVGNNATFRAQGDDLEVFKLN